ncbi:MAG: hypothetical protein ACRDH7_14700 [Actinomycetota bacterium]
MRGRLAPAVLMVALVAAACGPSISGPNQPAAPDQVTPDDAVRAAGARAAARAFVQAYADATSGGSAALGRLAGTDRLRAWVHWLGVQNDQFPGTISGSVEADEIGPAAPFAVSSVPGSETILRQVDVQATVTFSLRPTTGTAVSETRSLDGPMRLIFDERDVSWKVLDFTRDGVPFSRSFEIVKHATATLGGTAVTIDSFVSVPYWEFFLRVTSDAPAGLTRSGAELVNTSGRRVASANDITSSLQDVSAGSPVEGIVTFPIQPNAEGLTLRLRLHGLNGVEAFEFVLSGIIHPIPVTTASPSPSTSAS